MKTLLPQTIGVDIPRPGMATFHLMFFSLPHSMGGAPSATPWPDGPRQVGQFDSAERWLIPRTMSPDKVTMILFMSRYSSGVVAVRHGRLDVRIFEQFSPGSIEFRVRNRHEFSLDSLET